MLSLEMEFKEFEPRFKSAKTRFELSANQPYLSRGLNLKCRSNSLNTATGLKPEFLQILSVDFLRTPSVTDLDFLHFELRLTPYFISKE